MKKIIDKSKFGPWAIITGASSGIGEGFARQLAADGLNLVLVARRLPLLERIGESLAQEFGIQYQTIEADLAQESAIEKIISATEKLDVGLLISNAGTGKVAKYLSLELAEIKSVNQLNAISHLSLTHHFGRRFLKRGKGGVLLSGAMGAPDGVPYMSSMAGSKALVLSLGKSLHYEFKNTGINITVLEITPTDTAIIPKLGFDKNKMPMKPLLVEQCVEEALAALIANRVSIMPGRMYRIMNALVPSSVKRNMAGNLFKKNNNIS
jgi:short-subunit dehydrogenase